MSDHITPDQLRASLDSRRPPFSHFEDEQDARLQALVVALESIGWRGGDTVDANDVAALLLPHLDACAAQHLDMAVLYRDVAEVLRGAGPMLDGGLPPVSEYLPAAEAVVRRFVTGG